MKNTLLEKRRKIEEIASLCEEVGSSEIAAFAEILRKTGDINEEDNEGWTLLMKVTSYFGYIEIAELLVIHPDIQVNKKNKHNETALMLATESRNKKAVEILLSHPDTQINEKNNIQATALMLAAGHKTLSIFNLLLEDRRMDIYEYNQLAASYDMAKTKENKDFIKTKLEAYDML